MIAALAWDQTLVSLALAGVLAWLAYRGAARVLVRQERQREARARAEALELVLAAVEGAAGEYLADPSTDYPQREMVELERRALQAQLFFHRDLELQRALCDISYPGRYRDAAARLRAAVDALARESGPRRSA